MKRIRVVVGVMAVLSVGAVAVWTRQMETDQSGPEGSSPPPSCKGGLGRSHELVLSQVPEVTGKNLSRAAKSFFRFSRPTFMI